MKFNSFLDFRLFIRNVEDDIKDSAFLLKLKSYRTEIPDEEYFVLSDGVDSYIGELKYYSKGKSFYKGLLKDELGYDNLANLYAFMTHLSLGLCKRMEIRKNVDIKDFKELRSQMNGMVDEILEKGKVKNKLYNILK